GTDPTRRVDKPLNRQNRRGLSAADERIEPGWNHAVRVWKVEGILRVELLVPVLSAADVGGEHGLWSLETQPFVQPLQTDDDDECKAQQGELEPRLHSRAEQVP